VEKENIINAICITLDDWRCDQYRWVNQGVTKLPRKDPKIRKLYFDSDTPNDPSKDFQRHAYQLLSEKTLTVIHYQGDESASVDFCHRSATKHLDQAFKRTCPSQLKMFEQLCTSDKANVVYKRGGVTELQPRTCCSTSPTQHETAAEAPFPTDESVAYIKRCSLQPP